MNRYNIALLPRDASVQSLITETAIKHFAAINDEYVLGKKALAHVTLCQFYAPDDGAAVAAFKGLSIPMPSSVTATEFRIRPGTLVNAGKFIAELSIAKTPELVEAQKACFQHLEREGLKALTPIGAYAPHITMARLSENMNPAPGMDNIPFGQPIPVFPAIGSSTEFGVFIENLAE